MIMTPIFSPSSLLDSITPESLVWWLARVTLLAAFTCAYLALARRARPATRHMVAVGSLLAIMLVPVASALLPAWSLPVLPGSAVPATDAYRTAGVASGAIDASPSEAVSSRAVKTHPAAEPVPAVYVSTLPAREPVATPVDWERIALLAWFVVATGLLFRTLVAALNAHHLGRAPLASADPDLVHECERARRVLGIGRAIDVSVSPDVTIPMVVGALRPRVYLPAVATVWSRERLGVVLLHEFAHVSRRDGLWMLVARVLTAIFWFHPLVWMLSGHVRREAERACDDIVLASGVRGSDYAGHLVAIARTAITRDPVAGSVLAFATRSTLERRVVSILSARAPRAMTSYRTLAAVAGGSLALFLVIAAARPTPVVSAQVATPAMNPKPVQAVREARATHVQQTTQPTYYLAGDRDERAGDDAYDEASELYHRHKYARAGEAYEKAARLGHRRATAWYNAGCSFALANQSARAIDALREAFEEGFDDPGMYASDEDLNSLRGDPHFKKLLDDVMNSDTATSSRRAAMRDYERLAASKVVDEGDWNSVGVDLMRAGDYAHADEAFDREFKLSKDSDAIYNKACSRSLAGKNAEALKLLEQSITTGTVSAEHMRQDPDLMPLHDEARFDQLVTLAEDLTLHQGDWWKSSKGWTWNGSDEKRWKKVIPHFEEVTRKHPDIGRAWFNLGFAQLGAEQAEPSTASFQRALDLGYRPETTMYNLACSEAQSGNIDAAFGWLERAEGAGMEMWGHAHWDDDLDPLRKDPRFKKYAKRWKAERNKHDHAYEYEYNDDQDDDEDNDSN